MTHPLDPIVSPDWLATQLDRVIVLDATYFLPADQNRARTEFAAAHLPGARFFDIDAVSDHDAGLPHMLPLVSIFAATMAALGIDSTKPVVIYDRSPNHFSAPRVWFTLRVFGLTEVLVLDGGFLRWQAEGRPIEPGEQVAASVPARDWQPDLARIVSGPAMAALVAEGRSQIIDARSGPRFRGKTVLGPMVQGA